MTQRFKLQRRSKVKGRRGWKDFGGTFDTEKEAKEEKMKLTVKYKSHFDGPMKFRVRKVMD